MMERLRGASAAGVALVDDGPDAVESAKTFAEVDAAEAARAERPAAWDELLTAPPPGHAARAVAIGAITEALARVARRPPRPGESPAEARMREVAGRYLELRLLVAAGAARIAIG
jgi:hypothetical protein